MLLKYLVSSVMSAFELKRHEDAFNPPRQYYFRADYILDTQLIAIIQNISNYTPVWFFEPDLLFSKRHF